MFNHTNFAMVNALQWAVLLVETDQTYFLLQHRIASVSDVLGSWGGVFSLVVTVYQLLFGVG